MSGGFRNGIPLNRPQALETAAHRRTQSYEQLRTDEIGPEKHNATFTRYRGHTLGGNAAWPDGMPLKRTRWLHLHFWQETWSDVKEVPWTWLAYRAGTHILPPLFAAGLIVLLIMMSIRTSIFTYASDNACTADGQFSLSAADSSPWLSTSAFAINMRLGSSSFAVVKLVDICWDVVS